MEFADSAGVQPPIAGVRRKRADDDTDYRNKRQCVMHQMWRLNISHDRPQDMEAGDEYMASDGADPVRDSLTDVDMFDDYCMDGAGSDVTEDGSDRDDDQDSQDETEGPAAVLRRNLLGRPSDKVDEKLQQLIRHTLQKTATPMPPQLSLAIVPYVEPDIVKELRKATTGDQDAGQSSSEGREERGECSSGRRGLGRSNTEPPSSPCTARDPPELDDMMMTNDETMHTAPGDSTSDARPHRLSAGACMWEPGSTPTTPASQCSAPQSSHPPPASFPLQTSYAPLAAGGYLPSAGYGPHANYPVHVQYPPHTPIPPGGAPQVAWCTQQYTPPAAPQQQPLGLLTGPTAFPVGLPVSAPGIPQHAVSGAYALTPSEAAWEPQGWWA